MTRDQLADWLDELGRFWKTGSGDPTLPLGVKHWEAAFKAAKQLRLPPDPMYTVRLPERKS